MESEIINRVEVLDSGELLLGIESHGKPMYQYVYREAAGVYWDETLHGFKSTPIKEWSCSDWFFQIVTIVKSGLGIQLQLGKDAIWLKIPDQDILIIQSGKAI